MSAFSARHPRIVHLCNAIEPLLIHPNSGIRHANVRQQSGTASLATQIRAEAAAGAAAQRERTQELVDDVKRLALNTLRWGAEAAEATFREVVAQGPEKTLGRGFAVVHSATGEIVTSAAAARDAKNLQVQFQDGSIDATVRRDKENP